MTDRACAAHALYFFQDKGRGNGQTKAGVITMAKQGMKRPDRTKLHPKNEAFVPQIQGKARTKKEKANPIIAGTIGAEQKVWHEPAITNAHGPYDNDLATDNLEKNIPFADLQDL